MNSKNKITSLGIAIFILGIAALACNVPRNLVTFVFKTKDAEKVERIITEFDATLVSDEGELESLPLSELKWVCEDVDGRVSEIRSGAEMEPTFIFKEGDLDLWFENDMYDDKVDIYYTVNFERDEAVIGKDNQIVAWYTSKWGFSGQSKGVSYWEDSTFSADVFVLYKGETSAPNTSPVERRQVIHLFGMIDKMNVNKAYICDMDALDIPAGWEDLGLIGEEFETYCPGYYYECFANK